MARLERNQRGSAIAGLALGIAVVGYVFAVFVFPALDRSTYARIDRIPCAAFAKPAPHGCASTTTTGGR